MSFRTTYSMRIFPRRRMWLALTGILVCAILFFGILSVVYWLRFSSSAYFGEAEDIYVLASTNSSTVKQSQVPLALAPALIELPGIHGVSPELFIYGVLNEKAVIIRGIFPSDFARLESLRMLEGRWLTERDIRGAVAGVNLAKKLDLQVNDTYVISGSEVDDFITVKILGIFQGKGMIDDDLMLNMEYSRFLQKETPEGKVSIIRAKVNTSIWPTVDSIWETVSGPPNLTAFHYSPAQPNNTRKIQVSCRATALNRIASVVLQYRKSSTKRVGQKTLSPADGPDAYSAAIGPIKDSPWIEIWVKATDVLGHEVQTDPVNLTISDALGPDIYNFDIEPPPPQTKDHDINITFKITDTSELVTNVTVHTYNEGANLSHPQGDSSGGIYRVPLGRFEPGELAIWVTAKDRLGNPTRTRKYVYRILNKTDQSPPDVRQFTYDPDPAHDNSTVNLTILIVDDSNITTANVVYDFQVRGIHFNGSLALNRSLEGRDLWTAVTGPFPGATTVHFRIQARDEFGNAAFTPSQDVFIRYSVPPEIVDIYRFPRYSPPGVGNLLFMNLYDASEIQLVNLTYLDRGKWWNLSIPVNLTTYREPLLLGRISPGVKEYNLTMIDRRGEHTMAPGEGMYSFLVDNRPPFVFDVQYSSVTEPKLTVPVSFMVSSDFPLAHVYITDSRGAIEHCTFAETEFIGVLGPYTEPGDHPFVISAEDAAGNVFRSGPLPLLVLDQVIKDIRLSPATPLLGESLTVSCRVDIQAVEVNLIAQVGTQWTTPMTLKDGRWSATILIDSPGVKPFLVEARSGGEVYRSKVERIAIDPRGTTSLIITHSPQYPSAEPGLEIRIAARDETRLRLVILELANGTGVDVYRKVWYPEGSEFGVDYSPGTQLGEMKYRLTVLGDGTNVTYPVGTDKWVTVQVARNSFDPPLIDQYWLSPQTYVNLKGERGEGFLVKAEANVTDQEGISRVWIEYEVDGRTYTDRLFPTPGIWSFYTAYLGPFDLNSTIRSRISATDIAGLTSWTPYFQYTLVDDQPPEITAVYHDPFEPSPREEWVEIGCEVTDDSGVKEVLLVTRGPDQELAEPMDRYGNSYTLKVFPPDAGKTISYRILAVDNYGNQANTTNYLITSIDINPPRIDSVFHEPEEPSDTDNVTVTVYLQDHEDAVENVTLYWYQYEWRWKTQDGGEGLLVRTFSLNASEFDPGTDVRYKVEAFDRSGNRASFPAGQQSEAQLKSEAPPPKGGLGQEAYEPYLKFSVVDRTNPTISLVADPLSPNELQTVSFAISGVDNHILRNVTLHVYVDGVHIPYSYPVGRSDFEAETDSGPLTPGGSVVYYLEAYDQSGNFARYPRSANLSISVRKLEYGGQIAVRDPRVDLEVAAPAGFSEDMARQGAGKIIASINGILFMTFVATVAGIGNIVYTSVYKSKREIGIVRTLGGSKKFITIFVASLTILVGFLAGLLGVGFAYLLITAFSNLGATLAWVTLKPTFNVLLLGATLAASVTISAFGGLVALARLFSYTPVESIRSLIPPAPKEEHEIYVDKTRHFPLKTMATLLVVLAVAGCMMRLYPTIISGEPFDPDSWLHLSAARDIVSSGHIRLDYASRELQAVAALPGLNVLLVFIQQVTGAEIAAGRFLTPLVSALGLLFAFVLARRITKSNVVAGVMVTILAFVGFYANRTSALTKEAVALQMLLLCLYLLYMSRTNPGGKYAISAYLASIALMLTHHLTAIYFVLVLAGYLALANLQRYSKGSLDLASARRDGVLVLAVILSFLAITFSIGRYETEIPFQDALLILSLFFVCIGFGRLLLASSFMDRHRRIITVAFGAGLAAFPLLAYRAGLFSWAPWEEVVPMLGPHLVILGLAAFGAFPLSLLPEEEKGFLLAWASAIMPFLLFGLVKRDLFGYILLFRNIPYGYQLAALLAGLTFVYFYKKFEWGRTSSRRSLLVVLAAMLLACTVGLASYMGFLSQDYERKDLYHPREYEAAIAANASTLRGQLLGADERARRLLLYVTNEDGDQTTTYVYMIRMEKYLINQLRQQIEMTDRPLTHIFTYSDMYTVGFIDTVLFSEVDRLKLNRYEDVIFDNGDDELIYVARKEWP